MKKMAIVIGLVLALVFATGGYAVNSLTVSAAAALNGTAFGLSVNLDDSANNVYVETQHPTAETHYLIRFWVNPALLTNLPNNRSLRIGGINSIANGQRLVYFLRKDAPVAQPAQYQVNVWGVQDSNPSAFAFLKGINIGPVAAPLPNQVEAEWTRSTGVGVPDSVFRIQRITPANPGINQVVSNLVMFNFNVDDTRFGVLAGSGTSMVGTGSYSFDEFESYR